MIPYGRQNINQDDIDAVIEVLKSDFITQGPLGPLFEETVANYCGAQFAVSAIVCYSFFKQRTQRALCYKV